MDYYRILGVEKDASIEDIKNAYRNLAKKYHPDINQDKNAEYLFIKIKEAYETLTDNIKKHEYDDKMGFNYKYNEYENEPTENNEEEQDEEFQEYKNYHSNNNNKEGAKKNKIINRFKYPGFTLGGLVLIIILAFTVFYKPVPTAINLDHDILNMEVSTYKSLNVTVIPARASNVELIWTSNNPQIIEVNNTGKLFAHDGGTATITVRVKNSGLQSECKVVASYKYVTNHESLHGVYTGTIKVGMPHGTGVMNYKDGSKYEGEWESGKRHGFGIYKTDDYTYEGEWENGNRHGYGTLLAQNGSTYEGEWENDLPHGYGTFIAPDWSKYEGDFKEGKPHGRGVFIAPDGNKYKFQYIEGRPVEKGVVILPDGRTYEATYKNNRYFW